MAKKVVPTTYFCSFKDCKAFVKRYGERCKKHRFLW